MRTNLLIISLLTIGTMGFSQGDSTLKIMTFNLRYDAAQDTANPWAIRGYWVADLVRFHQPDALGVQEALHHQLVFLDSLLPNYDRVGVGRDDGKQGGEYSAILYNTDRLAVLESGNFWLSETPDIAGSMSWGTACTRMVTWAKFQDRTTGQLFWQFNTHFDHHSEKARQHAAELLLQRTRSMTQPVFLTGDFNALRGSRAYEILTQTFEDTEFHALEGHYGASYTFTGFQPVGKKNYTIDFIFFKKYDPIAILKHAALTDNWDGKYPSDHLPVLVEISWKKRI